MTKYSIESNDGILGNYLNELFGRKKEYIGDILDRIILSIVPEDEREDVIHYLKQRGYDVSFKGLMFNDQQKLRFFDMLGKHFNITFTSGQVKNTHTLLGVVKILNSKGHKD